MSRQCFASPSALWRFGGRLGHVTPTGLAYEAGEPYSQTGNTDQVDLGTRSAL